ncbi:TIGR03619 family F420-dependent LLM class oxidoreductase [Mycolicibacterium holsaticum]|uniref:TIGR03619 family F420-dependent LLM class oxidoreductase n=1 Tax=Mycolicibacterium holsaticum TaxID=152142 RepID=UPI001C7D2577|nr:TIGR03619 family F420-dependent LLM class oxidoreductase [Mycolicibacterium holsaticum]MDA4107030.1 luciferase [Mycolicibacterium holsaticum DSM 44478 = JCM 12374]QZA12298.1 TIGR03619 family F420-dependent LLM class oxidoreductase [Mycolicibacterium holsaticum DSM 44478 = JCM 12374]UNC10216.1 TIGR03619 family F420-dependent LLM class oxidoreductase [Mycolicibacterium holsaticum DSM 44478 = JCM 12374]
MTVSYSLELPTQRVEAAPEFVTAEAIAEIARSAEAGGFAAVHVTDHPAPDAKWLDHGGHHALDPFVALSFAAAVTTDVKLLTNVYIAAYRNPFLGAKSIQSLAVLSGGRLILGTAAGYLKPEFKALGIDFDTRGALLDEALDVLSKLMTGEDTAYEGTSFNARGVRLRPVPATPPPIWVGGNSKPAVRRAVSRAQGWAPFNTFGYAAASRTAEISTLEDLESVIAWAKRYAAEVGRTAPLDICFSAGNLLDDTRSTDERHATIAKLESMGVTWLTIAPQGADRAEVIDHARAFAEEFIA